MTFTRQTTPKAFPSLTELARALRAGETSSVALTQDCLQRIATFDAHFHAFIAVYADEALAAAAQADQEIQAGRWRGPLHGIPVALKDLVNVQGQPTTAGSPLLADNIAQQDAAITTLIRDAGGIVIGKTHMVQFALGAWGTNTHMAEPRNPAGSADERLVPGGSSSGSAVAVAAHLVPWAVGSDTGGSVRVPAAFCGIVGFKPTIDALPRGGVYALSDSLDSLGVFTQSVDDAAQCCQALGVPANAAQKLGGRRIGYLDADELAPLEPAVAQCLARNLQALEHAGFTLVPFRFPAPLAAFKEVTNAIMITEGAAVNDRFLDDPALPMDPSVRPRMLAARAVTAVQYLQAQATTQQWQQQFDAEMLRLDLAAVAMPATFSPAPRADAVDHNIAPVHFTRPINLLAICGISLPAGVDARGRPIGLQLAGRAGHDQALLEVSARAEAALASSLTTP